MESPFHLKSNWAPAGDQPTAIESLCEGLRAGERYQTLLGVTGSGKTFTAANVIARHGKPTLVLAHNKTLAAQLAQEYRTFFPDAAVHYFVSYYDFYQPEAYLPATDTYIEKDAAINEEIERLRHAATQALLTREDVIIVASVSAIYGLGSPEEYRKVNFQLSVGDAIDRGELIRRLVAIYFERTPADLSPGTFRAIGSTVEIMGAGASFLYAITLEGGTVSRIARVDALTRSILAEEESVFVFPAKHFVTPEHEREGALAAIEAELEVRLGELTAQGKNLEAERLKRRTRYDIAMIREVGYANGIENYSRHFSGKAPGEPPDTLLSYFPHHPDGTANFLTIVDESHVTLPQIRGMYAGDQSRKKALVEYGFRLPSALDNRPLRFEEWEERVGQVICTSATPSPFERSVSSRIVEQVIRPTGLLDPEIILRPVVESGSFPGQVPDFIREAKDAVRAGDRVLVTTLTKKMAEDLATYLRGEGVRAEYVHSDVKTIERIEILTRFRKGDFDCLVGVNLLREGLDLPEVSIVGILDADKEGFLRSETALIQTIGRAARNERGRVILYADVRTDSLEAAISETNRRRGVQAEYNRVHGITPLSVHKEIHDITDSMERTQESAARTLAIVEAARMGGDLEALIKEKEEEMSRAVAELDFETAAILRDEIKIFKGETVKPKRRGRSAKR